MDEDCDKRLNDYSIELALKIKSNKKVDVEALKKELAKKHNVPMIKSAGIIARLPTRLRIESVISKLRTRLTRTGSGVTPIALMPKPYPCPGRCTYCPQGENAPKSYTGFEPATMRAIQNDFDAKKQIDVRISQYEALGQPTQKCELIVMGGTFLSIPLDYQNQFVKECYDSLNGRASKTFELAKKKNETAKHRMVGMTIETRPDWCEKSHIDRMLDWGVTRVELGVQTLDDKVLKKVNRGHDVNCVVQTTKNLKDSAFKVAYHFMPGLYSNHKKDVQMLRKLFENDKFKPDMLKLYPCLVMDNTKIYEEYKQLKFNPIDSDEAVSIIADATKYFPPWVRVMRMQRDIPARLIKAGVKSGNLHQLVQKELERRNEYCKCIRCREVFSLQRNNKKSKNLNFEIVERKYNASKGVEHFISFEDKSADLIAGFIRLRFPFSSHRLEITDSTALIRELHVYGQELSVGSKSKKSSQVQHTGMGKKLLERAEQIALNSGKNHIAIISGVGVRDYYRKFGYNLVGPYMCKKLSQH